MKPSTATKHRVTPVNLRSGAKAPYFIVETEAKAKRDEISKLASEEFKNRSSLSRSETWSFETEKI
jgi:hypothetical protein